MATRLPSGHLVQRFMEAVGQHKDAPCIWEKSAKGFEPLSWKDVASRVSLAVRSFTALEIKKQDRVAVLLEQTSLAIIADLALMTIGAPSVAIPLTFTPDEQARALSECAARVAVVKDTQAAHELQAFAAKLPALETIIVARTLSETPQSTFAIYDWPHFMDKGRALPDKLLAMVRAIQPKDTASMLYTRTETGDLHAITRSHADIYASCESAVAMNADLTHDAQDAYLVTVPHSNKVGNYLGYALPFFAGAQLYLAPPESLSQIGLANAKPTYIIGTSEYFTALKEHVIAEIEKRGKVDAMTLGQALKLGKIKYESPIGLSFVQRAMETSLKAMITNKLRAQWGGRLKAIITIDDAIKYDTQLFYFALDIDLLEVSDEETPNFR